MIEFATMSAPAFSNRLLSPRYWPTWSLILLMRLSALLPYRAMMALGRVLGRVVVGGLGVRARVVDANLALCFPELDERARKDLARRHAASLGMAMMDFAIAWWWPTKRLAPLIEVVGREHIEEAISRGGVILLTAHFTSIEISGRILLGICPVVPMYRPSNNPVLEYFMAGKRESRAGMIIPRRDVRLMIRMLKQGKAVWFAPDQNFGAKGHVFAPFFGVPAASNTSLGRFAAMTGAAVVPFVVLRRPEGGYRLVAEPALEGFPNDDPATDVATYNSMVERWVREAPEQYNWVHRRFKKRPPGEQKFY